jgi:hypothetical protein
MNLSTKRYSEEVRKEMRENPENVEGKHYPTTWF